MRILFISTILILCCLAGSCGLFSAKHHVVASEAMSPTINLGDHFASVGIKNNDIDPIERFNIVTFKPPKDEKRHINDDTRFVFRIIALGGEKVEIKKGNVFINDIPLDETSFEKRPSNGNFKAVVVPPNEYFLLGDNRSDSMDSRYIGTIKREDIDGKVSNIIRKEDYDNGKRW